MDYTAQDVKDLVTIAKPLIDPIIQTVIAPKIAKLTAWIKRHELKNKVLDNFFENKFEEYLGRRYDYFQNINVLIFQNQQVNIKQIYHPLTIVCTKDNSRSKITDYDPALLKKYKKILISDSAGMGKSTLMKWISHKVIESKSAIPVLIELRNLSENHTVLDEIFSQINPIDKSFEKDLIMKFLELGSFVIFLDGFDEIQQKNQEVIIKDIKDFVGKLPKNHFILTSRPEGALASFGDFQLFHIVPLVPAEAFQLIKKYDAICPIKIAEKLITDIKRSFNQTRDLLGNPFLVSLIYSTYTHSKDIPSKKVTFYEEIYSALYKRHDLSKDGWSRVKKSKLDIQLFKIVLRQMAFDTAKAGTIVYTDSEILRFISEAKRKSPGVEFNDADFLDDLLSAVPLFQRDGSKMKWAHKSIQDYFVADFIAFSNRKEEIILRIYKSEKDAFLNVLDLFFELDYKTFRKIIVKSLLEEFVAYCDSSYNDIVGIPKAQIDERRSKTFGRELIILNDKKGVSNEIFHTELEIAGKDSKQVMAFIRDKSFVIVKYSFKQQIVELLANRELYYFYDKTEPAKTPKITLRGSGRITIDDRPDSEVNSKKSFSKVNELLSWPLRKPSSKKIAYLDIDKARTELELINSEIKDEQIIDHFDDI